MATPVINQVHWEHRHTVTRLFWALCALEIERDYSPHPASATKYYLLWELIGAMIWRVFNEEAYFAADKGTGT